MGMSNSQAMVWLGAIIMLRIFAGLTIGEAVISMLLLSLIDVIQKGQKK